MWLGNSRTTVAAPIAAKATLTCGSPASRLTSRAVCWIPIAVAASDEDHGHSQAARQKQTNK